MPAPFGERTYRTPSRSQYVQNAIAHLKSNPREQLVIGSAVRTFNQFGDEMQPEQETAQEQAAQAQAQTQATLLTEEETKEAAKEATKEQPTHVQYDEGGCTSMTFLWILAPFAALVVLALIMLAVVSIKRHKKTQKI